MDRGEFEALRSLPNKEISDDILFRRENGTTLSFNGIKVKNSMNVDLVLNGTFKPDFPSVIYNFSVRGLGPICRVCVNNTVHTGTRTHKHELVSERCPRRNIPNATPRPDLEQMTARQVWDDLCMRANITHTGKFIDPEEAE